MQIYQEMPQSDYSIVGVAIVKARKCVTLLRRRLATMTQSAQTTIPPNHHKALD